MPVQGHDSAAVRRGVKVPVSPGLPRSGAAVSHPLLALQRAAGNRSVARLLAQRDFSGSESATSNEGEAVEADGPRGSHRLVQQPAATADPARAKVQVNSVELSFLGYGHAFIVTTDDVGIRRYYRGGPTRQGTLGEDDWGTIRTRHGDYVPGTPDWTTRPDHTATVKQGPDALGFDAGLASEADNIEASATPYHPTGPNSNTTVRELLARNSLPQRRPQLLLPGWDDTIAP